MEAARKMMKMLTSALLARRPTWKDSSLEYLMSGACSDPGTPFSWKTVGVDMMCSQVEHMEILGSLVNKTGASQTSLDHRLAQATKRYYSRKQFLSRRGTGLSEVPIVSRRRVQMSLVGIRRMDHHQRICSNLDSLGEEVPYTGEWSR